MIAWPAVLVKNFAPMKRYTLKIQVTTTAEWILMKKNVATAERA